MGHECLRVREIVAADAPDMLIAFIAETEGLVIVSHDSDFKSIYRLLPAGLKRKVRGGAGVVHLQMRESLALSRMEACMAFIEFAYQQSDANRKRMHVRITHSGMTLLDNTRQT